MNMKKKIFDLVFIIISATILILLLEYNFLEKYLAFSLIPIMLAYFLGQYVERKFNDNNSN